MTVTHEELAAYADGELEGAEAARVLLAVAASPQLMRMAQKHRALRERIGAEFAPILDQEVPERLAALLRPPVEDAERDSRRMPEAGTLLPARVVMDSTSDARNRAPTDAEPTKERPLRRRRWLLLPVLAAALAAAATLPRGGVSELPAASKQDIETPWGR